MKNQQWLSKIKNVLSVSANLKSRRQSRYSNRLHFQQLEKRNLLATVVIETTFGNAGVRFTADQGESDSVILSEPSPGILQIQVGNGDSITVAPQPSGSELDGVNLVADDTLQLPFVSAFFQYVFDLGDQDDSFEVTSGLSGFTLPRFLPPTVLGGDGDDTIDTSLSNGFFSLFGGDGNDTINAGGRDDIIEGGAGNDTLNGGAGIDTINGGDGDDTLNGGEGDDMLFGDQGNDFLIGLEGTDLIDGGEGVDSISFQGSEIGVTASIRADGSGTAFVGSIEEEFVGIETLIGSDQDDTLRVLGQRRPCVAGAWRKRSSW